MPKEAQENADSTVVYIGGKRTTIGEVQKSYATVTFLSKPSAMRIVKILATTKQPLTRQQIAEQAKLSVVYTTDILNNLTKYDYVVRFHIGQRKLLFYALTEKGYNNLESKVDKTA